MILQALNELYDRLAQDETYGIAPPGFSPQKVSFKIVLRPDGTLLEPQSVDSKAQTRVLGDTKSPGGGINPCFLWDNQTYMLGRQPDEKKSGFGQARFDAFRKRHLEAEEAIGSPKFSAVCRFLENWQPDSIGDYPLLVEVGTGFGVFQIQGEPGYVHDDPLVLQWWEANQPKDDDSTIGQCLITGEDGPIARLHPKIKGVVGAQSSGAPIVSFNDTAYESYTKTKSYNSPAGIIAANRYGAALNSLLTGPMAHRHRLRLGDATSVFWTDKPTIIENCFAEIIGQGSDAAHETTQDDKKIDQIKNVLQAVRIGGRDEGGLELETDTPFYLLGLAANAARLSVRFFHRSSVGDLLVKLHQHQQSIQIVREYEVPKGKRPADAEFPPVWMLLRETARSSNDIPPLLGGALVRAIISGVNYPEGLYTAVIRRIHADRTVNYLRAALIKAVLTRNHQLNIPIMLDTDNTDPAYRLGRLFSALEKTQEDALPGLNATIRDRFYSSASATPRSVFPRLLRTYQHYLTKLSIGAKVNRERLIQEIMEPMSSDGFPAQLNIRDQGRFAIGYYHQRKDFFTAKAKDNETTEPATI